MLPLSLLVSKPVWSHTAHECCTSRSHPSISISIAPNDIVAASDIDKFGAHSFQDCEDPWLDGGQDGREVEQLQDMDHVDEGNNGCGGDDDGFFEESGLMMERDDLNKDGGSSEFPHHNDFILPRASSDSPETLETGATGKKRQGVSSASYR